MLYFTKSAMEEKFHALNQGQLINGVDSYISGIIDT